MATNARSTRDEIDLVRAQWNPKHAGDRLGKTIWYVTLRDKTGENLFSLIWCLSSQVLLFVFTYSRFQRWPARCFDVQLDGVQWLVGESSAIRQQNQWYIHGNHGYLTGKKKYSCHVLRLWFSSPILISPMKWENKWIYSLLLHIWSANAYKIEWSLILCCETCWKTNLNL